MRGDLRVERRERERGTTISIYDRFGRLGQMSELTVEEARWIHDRLGEVLDDA